MGSQWLGLLNLPSSRDPRDPREQSVARPTEPARFLRSTSPRGPQAPQIHRSTESTEPGSSPDLLDLSYAAMQITHSALILLYRQLLIQHAHAVKNQSIHNLTCPAHSHLCGLDLTVPLTSACSTCQREKVEAVVNPQLIPPMNKHINTLCGISTISKPC